MRPLELPWPYFLKSSVAFRQKVTLRPVGIATGESAARARSSDRIRIELGEPGPKLPEIGGVVYPGDVAATLANIEQLEELGPQRLLLHLDPTAGHGLEEPRAYAALAAASPAPATLECVVSCRRDLDTELSEIAAQVAMPD